MAQTRGDWLIRAMTEDDIFRVMTVRATDTVRGVVEAQQVAGSCARQIGEIVTCAVLVRETIAPGCRVQILLRNESDDLIVGDAFPEGRTRGLARVEDSTLGVRITGRGHLQVMRSLPGRAPHRGVVEVDADTGIDVAMMRYFHQSEQFETLVGVGCVATPDGIEAAGGFAVQLLPEITDPPLAAMRARIAALGPLGPRLVRHDADPEWMLATLLDGIDHARTGSSAVSFSCSCGDEKALGAAAALPEAELRELVASGKTLNVRCDYCRENYELGTADFQRILDQAS